MTPDNLKSQIQNLKSPHRGFTLVELPAVSKCERNAFTLVELLVVITIIGILASLISVAAVNALYQAKQVRIKFEVDQLDAAMKAFKQQYGAYPPCNLKIDTGANPNVPLKSFVAKAFPRYNQGVNGATLIADLQAAGIDTTIFDPARALVFWLWGFNPDVTAPFALTGGTRTPLYGFDKTRLVVAGTGAQPTSTTTFGQMWYVPQGGQGVPFVYFDSRSYATFSSIPQYNFSAIPQFSAAGVAMPYALDVNGNRRLDPLETFSDSNSNATWDNGESYSDIGGNSALDQGVDTWANADSIQIISAGQDGNFGLNATRVKLFPAGSGYDAGGTDNDNVTNFNDKASLEDARP